MCFIIKLCTEAGENSEERGKWQHPQAGGGWRRACTWDFAPITIKSNGFPYPRLYVAMSTHLA